MKDYVEDYRYNNCFWKKSGVLYAHSESKFKEFMSIGRIFDEMIKKIREISELFGMLDQKFVKPNEPNYTRENGIEVIFNSFKIIKNEFKKLANSLAEIPKNILDKEESFKSKMEPTKMCDNAFNRYNNGLTKLNSVKKSYFDTMNKVVELYLNQKFGKKGENSKSKQELNNKLLLLEKKKEDYKKEVENVENFRAEYMIEQGNIFADREEQERECTDDLKKYFKKYITTFENFLKNFKMSEESMNIIEKMNGDRDTKSFAESNKSLMTEPKRNVYKEYSIDINYYVDNFDILKSKIKGKTPKEQRELYKEISSEITNLLANIIKEEPDKIYIRIEQIAKDIKENRLSKNDFDYLIKKFKEQYDEFMDWKQSKVGDQEYKKVGKIWDERFFYMHVFLKYFNKTRVENKELNEENFNYLCEAIKKILELNESEDIDYNLCDLVVILSSTFYMVDPKSPKGKRYVNEVIRHSSIMQKQGFWVGLTRYELNEEIQSQNKIEDTLKENNITEEKLINSVIAKLMSVSYNIMQFVLDSELFNRIIHDVFKYCKINEQNRQIVVNMIDMQIQDEKIDYLKLDKENLLSLDKKE